jgi:uncharacterized protein YidB (DUF937 family)
LGVFDSIKNALGQMLGGGEGETVDTGMHQVLGEAIQGGPGGMGGLIAKLHMGGLSDVASSWTSGQSPLPISADQLRSALGDEHVEAIASKLGIQPDQALSLLQEHLPMLAMLNRPAEH